MNSLKVSELSDGRDYVLCHFLWKGKFMNKRIRLYEIQSEYIQYLSIQQKHIFVHKDGKSNRKYIGIVMGSNGMNYFAPLSSYKDKHKKMSEKEDEKQFYEMIGDYLLQKKHVVERNLF